MITPANYKYNTNLQINSEAHCVIPVCYFTTSGLNDKQKTP